MHKKLESDLISLAHSILQMKNKENVFLLKQKAYEIYEKLSVLAFVEEYVNTTPGIKVKKEELILKVEEAYKIKDQISKEVDEAKKVEVVAEDFKEVLLDVEKEKTNADIEDSFPKEEKVLEEIEDQSIDEIKEFLPYKVVETHGAEADDVIAILCKHYQSEKIMIGTGDKDFIQLQKYKNVRQYSPITKKHINSISI